MATSRLTRPGILTVGALLLALATAQAGPSPEQRCRANKNKTAGRYAACRQDAEAKLAARGDTVKYSRALAKCGTKFTSAWQKLEDKAAKAGATCADGAGTGSAFQAAIDDHTDNIATALDGGELAGQGRLLRTEQTTCYDSSGMVIGCGGTGQDGELQKGLARVYLDNADGTITDTRTGLVWEKLSADGSIHGKEGLYTWGGAWVKLAELNSGSGFAGHTDWRVPNRFELESLLNLGTSYPAVSPAFNTACAPACTVLTCSCTAASFYWSSTTVASSPSIAWVVGFSDGYANFRAKGDGAYVRAVRGGS